MMSISNLLDGKVVLITGCSKGIGKEIARLFLMNGAIVYANSRTEGSLKHLISELPSELQSKIFPVYFDVRNRERGKEIFLQIKKEQSRLDCLVNNAGIMKDAYIGMISKDVISETFETNVYAVIDLIQYATKFMKRQGNGSIINISSIIGINGNSGQVNYSASKGAVISITKSAAKELASFNIRVNAIAPGVINTELISSIDHEKLNDTVKNIGMGRIGQPKDIANLALFLASDMSDYVTGQIITVDGSMIL